MNFENDLHTIAKLYKSDKLDHGYIEVYDSYFKKIKDKENGNISDDVLKLIEPQIVAKFNYGDELEQEELSDIITETTVDDVTENS